MTKTLLTTLMVGALLATTGCKNIFRAYRIDIVQGQPVIDRKSVV